MRILTILDEYTRECHVLRVDRALKSADVLAWLQKAVEQQGVLAYLRSDNGSEFIAKVIPQWLKENQIKTIDIEPGSPWQNGFVESFHGWLRDDGKVPVAAQRQSIDAPPRSIVVRCLRPDGDIYYLRHAPLIDQTRDSPPLPCLPTLSTFDRTLFSTFENYPVDSWKKDTGGR